MEVSKTKRFSVLLRRNFSIRVEIKEPSVGWSPVPVNALASMWQSRQISDRLNREDMDCNDAAAICLYHAFPLFCPASHLPCS